MTSSNLQPDEPVNPQTDIFLRACYRQPVPYTPIWMMRQAGRYLPEYRALRSQYDFLTMLRTPELATEVTIQPVDIVGVDAAILFCDILVIPEAMGMELRFIEKQGPVFTDPLRSEHDIDQLKPVAPQEDLPYVMEAIRQIRAQLAGRVPLIGFAGSPWTLAAYMIEGQGSSHFRTLRRMLYAEPALLEKLLDKLTIAIAKFLQAQVEAGAQAIQIFDSWGGLLTREAYQYYSLPTIQRIIARLHRTANVPVILFSRGRGADLDLQMDSGADVLSVDWTIPIGKARQQVKEQVAIQGNLDPAALYAPPEILQEEAKSVLSGYGDGPGHIFNLGHGIFPDVPVEHVQALVEYVHNDRKNSHAN